MMLKTLLATITLVGGLAVASPAAGGSTAFINTSVDKSEVTAGTGSSSVVEVSTVLTSNGSPLADQTVSLYAKAYGEAEFSFVTETQTSGLGRASALHYPQKRTDYQWRCDVGDACPATPDSPVITVRVHTNVTMTLQDALISPGQKMVAVGTTTPAKPGATAKVFRITISGRTEKWFSGTVRADGTFRLARRVSSHVKYKVYVVVVAHTGNLKGTSPTRTLYVS